VFGRPREGGRDIPRPAAAGRVQGAQLTPDNVRLAHRLCNRRDYIWRMQINALLGKRMSLKEIAEKLNAEKVPTIHGTNRWTAASVRKAFVS
jgi:DNA-binding transcriptional MerR regulator